MNYQEIAEKVLALGADHAGVVYVSEIEFEPSFRTLCEQNSCGMYGKSWMCPPYVGEYQDLIREAQEYEEAIVYQIIGRLEDSYDFEGMMQAGKRMNCLTQTIRREMSMLSGYEMLFLGAGGCRVCPVCAHTEGKPCRYPEQALASLEAYCINVSKLAPLAGMKYMNGQDTVTYFGTILLKRSEDACQK